MTLNSGLFSSQTCEWATPQGVFDQLDAEFGFTLDACASPENAKCANYHSSEDLWSALTKPWQGIVWCNPPYGDVLPEWIKKGYEEAQKGAIVVMLIPSRTDTDWWHDYVMKANEIRFINGRLKFGGAKHGAPFPSAIVVFKAL